MAQRKILRTMSATAATLRSKEASPAFKARVTGAFYLLNTLTILLAVFCFRGLFVAGDPVTTATNLMAHQLLFRTGFAFEIVSTGCSIVVATLFYELFKPVDRSVSLLAAFFRLIACGIAVVGYLFQLAPLQVAGGAHYLSDFKPAELQALGLLLYSFASQASHIVIVFFGFHFVLIGYLIFRSNFLPRFLAILITLAGLGALTFLVPPLATPLFLYFAAIGLLGEVSLALWLLIAGVNVQRWDELARSAGN